MQRPFARFKRVEGKVIDWMEPVNDQQYGH